MPGDDRRRGLAANDFLFGLLLPPRADDGFPWAPHLAQLPAEGAASVVEWMVHQGRPDPALPALDEYVDGRVAEWRALTAPEHRALWALPGWTRTGKSTLGARPA